VKSTISVKTVFFILRFLWALVSVNRSMQRYFPSEIEPVLCIVSLADRTLGKTLPSPYLQLHWE